ncbi:methionine aminotransferase [Paracrocinitomix mangrovi]|uniref:methionine aminotransferase n=1 Tax=Paracrocinitomix mangrovi TaxID=2862509 RepID=UPI001EDA3FDF|nr:methionine aminotransferase [Paracrocinitomix mangrovi]UKN00752.1 methionine aminotransferase [Paracrocinitomix mangrovi]
MKSDFMMQSKLPDVGTTIFTVMSALANEQNAINLSQGFPNFPIDTVLKDFVKKALDEEQVQYAPMPGRLDLRIAIAQKLELQHAKIFNPETEITVTAGATEAIYSIIAAVVSKGDEVLMFDPAYDCYDPSVRLNGGIPVHLKLKFPDFKIDWNEVKDKINSKTKLIMVNNPHNPAGSVWDESDLKALEDICNKYPHLLVLSDEVYEHIQFDNNHQSVLKSDLLRSRSFVTYSFGKTFHVTGWKIGYCIAPAELTVEMRKVHQFNVFCVNNTMQAALADYLIGSDSWRGIADFYNDKKALFMNGMKQSKFKPLKCEGTYFCLYDFSEISSLPDVEFAKWMTIEHKVASIPVSVFYEDKTDNKVVRFCFAKTDDMLINAIDRLCKI